MDFRPPIRKPLGHGEISTPDLPGSGDLHGGHAYVLALSREEQHCLFVERRNVLLIGRDPEARAALNELRPGLRRPVTCWKPDEQLILPDDADAGTLVLEDLSLLPLPAQRRLNAWLETATGRTQVVSVTSRSLLSKMAAGTFLESLYYRLNIICVELDSDHDA